MDANISYWTIGSIVIGFLLILPSIMGLFSKNKFDVKGKVRIGQPVVHQPRLTTPKTVLLTGASEGMGLSVAKQLAQKGASIIIVARNVGRLEEALGQIKVSLLPQCRQC
jgi:3-dehydrosphinganine reductase